ncbi:MAG: NADH-quinone oxidoreductase subunit C [Gemmatimonadaceae bacterium]|nr:NADH-quinone oxidoreductase subunit C [Gemmatimonadaceae bacterium]
MTVLPGAALPSGTPDPVTPRGLPHRGGDANPSVEALRARFGGAIGRHEVMWGETTVWVEPARIREIVLWLRDDPTQQYDYLVDVTAVEHRDAGRPLEMVWHVRSLPYRRFLRLKAALPDGADLEVPSIEPVYKSANWLEREVWDMFGIRFAGHSDLRRILLWESYAEGYPLRKDFPLRGRFSRSEQLSQALAANPEARYSMEELTVADAFHELPADMRARLLAEHDEVGA